MDVQEALNWAFGVIGVLFGYILNSTRESVKRLTEADLELADKVQKIEVLVAGEYVKRDEIDHQLDSVSKCLDRIEDKLDAHIAREK